MERRSSGPKLFGASNPNWKGGVWVNSSGYIMVWVGKDHPLANCRAYAPRCRVVLSEKIGRWLESFEHAHHIDEDKANDHPDNLEVRLGDEHGRLHLPKGSERARKLGRKGGKASARKRRAATTKTTNRRRA